MALGSHAAKEGPRAPAVHSSPGLSSPFWTSVPPAPAPCCKGRQRGPQGQFGRNTRVLGCLRLHLPLTGSELSWREGGEGSQLRTASRAPRGHRQGEASPCDGQGASAPSQGHRRGDCTSAAPRATCPQPGSVNPLLTSLWSPGKSPWAHRSAREGWAPSETEQG